MNQEYLKLSVEELIDDCEFIAWALRGKNNLEWDLFLAENPEFKFKANKAFKIIELLRDQHDQLTEEDILKMWKNIDGFNKLMHTRQRQIKIRSVLRYAAILILFISISSTAYWLSRQNHKTYAYKSNAEAVTGSQSHLLLSDGRTVDLEKEDSKITLNPDQKIVLDNEKVIDLRNNDQPDESAMNEIVVPFGKKSQLILEDGTKVWLNAGTRMAFPTAFTGKKREVFLEGEAYFEVAHNQKLPFIVNTDEITIKVLGTRFNLSAYKTDNLIETLLIEGKVSISERSVWGFYSNETILTPNQTASFNQDDHSISVQNDPDVELAIAWTQGWFKFSQQSIDNVISKLERYYNVRFVFDHKFSASDLITGKLDLKESIEQVMIVLADVANIKYKIEGKNIYIDKND